MTVGRFQELIEETIDTCYDCFKNCKISICVNDISNNITRVKSMFSEFQCEFIVHNNNNFEFDTLNYLRNFSMYNTGCKIGYIHTKGVSTPDNKCIDDWRKYMLYFIGKKYKDCINYLDTYDVVGVDLVDEPITHFSGNFWWANSDYIRMLSKPEDIPIVLTKRHNCEFWICSGQGRYYSFNNSNINVYNRHLYRYPKENYENM